MFRPIPYTLLLERSNRGSHFKKRILQYYDKFDDDPNPEPDLDPDPDPDRDPDPDDATSECMPASSKRWRWALHRNNQTS